MEYFFSILTESMVCFIFHFLSLRKI